MQGVSPQADLWKSDLWVGGEEGLVLLYLIWEIGLPEPF